MANTLLLNSGNSVNGLGTQTYTVVTAGIYTVQVQATLPRDAGGTNLYSYQISPQASALEIVVNQNGTPIVTIGGASNDPTPSQPSLGTSCRIQCAAGDVITVVFSSANAVDAIPNNVKSTITIYQGD
jgi:hypothetical protein